MEGPWVAEGIRAQSYPVAVLVALVPYPQQWELNLATPENAINKRVYTQGQAKGQDQG